MSQGAVAVRVWQQDGAGAPLVLLHGVTRDGRDWRTVHSAFWPAHRVLALDQRGHGGSPRGESYRVVDYVADAARLVEGLGGRCVLVGHSLGAMVAAGVAAALPRRVAGLVLEDPTFEMTASRIEETWFADTFRAFLPHAGSTRAVEAIAADLGAAQVRGPGSVGVVPMSRLRDAAALRYAAACLKRLDRGVLEVILAGAWLEGYDVFGTLKKINCPTLMLEGDFEAGGALPGDYANAIAAAVADCARVRFAGVGHSIHSAVPHEFTRVVVPFLNSLEVDGEA